MLEQVEKAYDTVFEKMEADEFFFNELTLAYKDFVRRTAQRPITPRRVKTEQMIFRDACRVVMQEARDRCQKNSNQPRSGRPPNS